MFCTSVLPYSLVLNLFCLGKSPQSAERKMTIIVDSFTLAKKSQVVVSSLCISLGDGHSNILLTTQFI
jgi:hypothetical protein